MHTQTPKLRFPEFSDSGNKSYKKQSFKDIFLFSTGKNIKQNEASPEFETPCVRYGELYHMYNEVIAEVINKTNLDKSELLFSDGDEILLPSAGEDPLDIGSASALTVANVAIGRTINVLKPQKVNIYHQIFVAYYINQKLRKKISTLAKGSSISNVYNSDLKTLEITLPSFPEQTKIANFLTAIDEKIQALKQKKTLLEQYKKGIMQQIFSQQLRFKNDDGADFDDWEEKSLGDICEVITKGTTPRQFSNQGVKFIKTECFNEKGIDELKCLFVNEEIHNKELKRSILKENDILFAIAGSIGKVRIVKKNILPANTNQALSIIRLKEKEIVRFIFYILTSINMEKYILDNITVGAQPNLNLEQMNNYCFNYPSLPEQQKIANFLTAIDEKIEKVSQQISTTETYKKGLLQQMFV